MQKEIIKCNTEVAMETERWSDFVENVISKEFYEVACAFCDLWSLLRTLRTFKTSFVPINHEMHSRSCDFLKLIIVMDFYSFIYKIEALRTFLNCFVCLSHHRFFTSIKDNTLWYAA